MSKIHFLNVCDGDCTVIKHNSGHVTVIDVCNAGPENAIVEKAQSVLAEAETGVSGNFNQKKYPVNPISYLKKHGILSVFRFIATHPDMDHLDGIKPFFKEFTPTNFWDTANKEAKDFKKETKKYDEEDWKFYKELRDENPRTNPKRLVLHAGDTGKYFNEDEAGNSGGDGLKILAPTKGLVTQANECGDYNDCSYVLLYRTAGRKILFGGDSHDKTWEHILATYEDSVRDVDLLIAPHHGRASRRSYDFLDVLKPRLTLFGNARSEHLAYGAWNYRKLSFITNNQAGSVVIDIGERMDVYVTHKRFAETYTTSPVYSNEHRAYHLGWI